MSITHVYYPCISPMFIPQYITNAYSSIFHQCLLPTSTSTSYNQCLLPMSITKVYYRCPLPIPIPIYHQCLLPRSTTVYYQSMGEIPDGTATKSGLSPVQWLCRFRTLGKKWVFLNCFYLHVLFIYYD